MVKVSVLLKPWAILKFIQVFIAITCIALLRHYHLHFGGETSSAVRDRELVGVMTIGGMILVSLPLLVSYLFSGDSYRPTLDLVVGLTLTALGVTAGSLAIDRYRYLAETETVQAGLAMGELIYSVMGFMLFITAGGLCLEYYQVYRNKPGNINAGKSLGSLLIINAVFYLIDAVFAFKNLGKK